VNVPHITVLRTSLPKLPNELVNISSSGFKCLLPKSRQDLYEEAQNDAVYEAQNDEKEGKEVRWVNYSIHMPAAAILFS
jgi:hypothetical protein